VSGEVETFVYASKYDCLLVEVFLLSMKFFLIDGCVYVYMPCMHVLDMP